MLVSFAEAKAYISYPPPFDDRGADWKEGISFPHIYPGQTIVSEDRFLEDSLRPGSKTVRWTSVGSYSIHLDRTHLMRNSYTLIIRSKYGPEIRQLPFDTTKLYLLPNYYKIRYDKDTYTVWLARYAD